MQVQTNIDLCAVDRKTWARNKDSQQAYINIGKQKSKTGCSLFLFFFK